MIEYSPTAAASTNSNPPNGSTPPLGKGPIPFTPGQSAAAPVTPPPAAPIVPQIGSAGQTLLPGSTVKQNIAAAPAQFGDFFSHIASKFPGQDVGKVVGTYLGYALSKANDLLSGRNDAANYDLSTPSAKEVAGDAGKGILAIAAPELNAETRGARIAATTALGAGAGATDALSKDANFKDTALETVKGAGIGAATGAFGEGLSTIVGKVGNLLENTGDKIAFSVIKPTQADIKDGFSIDTVKKYDLGGSLKTTLDKTNTLMGDLGTQLKTKLGASNASIDLNTVYENTAKRLLGSNLESFGANTSMEKAIEQLKGEVAAVSGNNGLVSIPDAQTVKQASGTFGAWLFGNPDPEATARQKVYNTFYNELKTAIEKNSPEGVQGINKQFSELIPVRNAVLRRIPVAERNSALSLNDMIGLAASAIEPRALALTLANFVAKSGQAGAAASKAGAALKETATGPALNGAKTLLRTATPPIVRSVGSAPSTKQQ